MDPSTRQAFTLWTQAQPAVSAYVFALTGDRALRDEILQATALSVLESFGTYDASRPFLPWALSIARNEVANARRQARRVPMHLSTTLGDAAEEALARAVDAIAREEHERLAHLGECVKLLEGRAREICDYRYRAGLKPGRIAELLGLAPNTVSKALERLRGDLRDCIERREAGGAA